VGIKKDMKLKIRSVILGLVFILSLEVLFVNLSYARRIKSIGNNKDIVATTPSSLSDVEEIIIQGKSIDWNSVPLEIQIKLIGELAKELNKTVEELTWDDYSRSELSSLADYYLNILVGDFELVGGYDALPEEIKEILSQIDVSNINITEFINLIIQNVEGKNAPQKNQREPSLRKFAREMGIRVVSSDNELSLLEKIAEKKDVTTALEVLRKIKGKGTSDKSPTRIFK